MPMPTITCLQRDVRKHAITREIFPTSGGTVTLSFHSMNDDICQVSNIARLIDSKEVSNSTPATYYIQVNCSDPMNNHCYVGARIKKDGTYQEVATIVLGADWFICSPSTDNIVYKFRVRPC